MIEDPRKTGLKNGLRQLTIRELNRVKSYAGDMVLDIYNYQDGKFCPLAVAVSLDKTMENPTHDSVFLKLNEMGYKVYNTRGIEGEFYTTDRKRDLLIAVDEVIEEKVAEIYAGGECACGCGVCKRGFHIFCNFIMHGNKGEALKWFVENPDAARSVIPRDDFGKEIIKQALSILDEQEKKG